MSEVISTEDAALEKGGPSHATSRGLTRTPMKSCLTSTAESAASSAGVLRAVAPAVKTCLDKNRARLIPVTFSLRSGQASFIYSKSNT